MAVDERQSFEALAANLQEYKEQRQQVRLVRPCYPVLGSFQVPVVARPRCAQVQQLLMLDGDSEEYQELYRELSEVSYYGPKSCCVAG